MNIIGKIALLSICGAGVAVADPTFTNASKETLEELAKADKVEWKASAQAGLIMTAGNSKSTAISAGATASRKADANKIAIEGSMSYARSSVFVANDVNTNMVIEENEISRPSNTTSKMYQGKLRYDRYLGEANSLYAAALGLSDEPSGKDFVGGGQAGYSRRLYKSDAHEFLGEVGYDFSYENLSATEDSLKIHSLRLFAGYTGKLAEDSGLEASVEGLFNVNTLDNPTGGDDIKAFKDTRVNSKLALTTKLFKDISFRFGFEGRFDNAPAPRAPFGLPYAADFVPLADKFDMKAEASLIISFL